jgi:hypothetical protein
MNGVKQPLSSDGSITGASSCRVFMISADRFAMAGLDERHVRKATRRIPGCAPGLANPRHESRAYR